jgi:hypothetical protein
MATLINITRSGNTVTFDPVSVVPSELVVWVNQDPKQAHWPSLSPNQIGPAPSKNSSAVPLTNPGGTPPASPPNLAFQVKYTCTLLGHQNEAGIINVFNQFQAGIPAAGGKVTFALPAATTGLQIKPQVVAAGGMSPYTINSQQYQVTDATGNIVSGPGSGPGPGLTLTPDPKNNGGISISGMPSVSGTYTFTFDATDGMGINVQQSQFTMAVS